MKTCSEGRTIKTYPSKASRSLCTLKYTVALVRAAIVSHSLGLQDATLRCSFLYKGGLGRVRPCPCWELLMKVRHQCPTDRRTVREAFWQSHTQGKKDFLEAIVVNEKHLGLTCSFVPIDLKIAAGEIFTSSLQRGDASWQILQITNRQAAVTHTLQRHQSRKTGSRSWRTSPKFRYITTPITS